MDNEKEWDKLKFKQIEGIEPNKIAGGMSFNLGTAFYRLLEASEAGTKEEKVKELDAAIYYLTQEKLRE